MQLIERAHSHPDRYAVISEDRAYTYAELLARSEVIALQLLDGLSDLSEARIAMMVAPGFDYVATQWGIWRAGGIAVPMALSYPLPELAYVANTVACRAIVAGAEYVERLQPLADSLGIPLHPLAQMGRGEKGHLPQVHASRGAMILYTSGTTSRPKGVVITHANLEAQMRSLTEAWAWQPDDHILNVLPLHHVHGITNMLCCALWNGAICEFLPQFDPVEVWERLASGELTLFMAVPTIYTRLIRHWEGQSPAEQDRLKKALPAFRLMVSGSAALPVSVLEKWEAIAGQRLLERYGMTEIGMALSNPYAGERRAGHVGVPLPGVEVRLLDAQAQEVPAGEPGEIFIRSANVFREYWERPEATASAFWDGWFRTGDMAVVQNGYYRILGRASVDILKSGGYKISALEIEEVFRQHPQVRDCAVVGLPDEEWGDLVAMAVVVAGTELEAEALLSWAKARLAPYKLPRKIIFPEDLPRNALGKVMKPRVKKLFE